MDLADTLGQLHSAFIEIRVDLGFGEFNSASDRDEAWAALAFR